MRQTAKYIQACQTAREKEGVVTAGMAHDELYKLLELAAWGWSSKRGKWEKRPAPNLVGETTLGEGNGIFRARLMAHPAEIDSLVADAVKSFQALGYIVDDVSDKYPNRRGVGTRVYLTMTKARN